MRQSLYSFIFVVTLVCLLAMPAMTQTQERGSGSQSSTSRSSFTPSCPQEAFNGEFPSVSTSCQPCQMDAQRINEQIAHTRAVEAALNALIEEYNELCEDDGDDPRDVQPPDEDGPFYCGPDISAMMLESLQRVRERMEQLPDNEKGLHDAANPLADSFLMRNGTNIDQKPDLESFSGSDQCPSGPCAPDGNHTGQICYTLWGNCVPQHVMNEIMFGFTADQVYVPEVVQWIGGHFHEFSARGNFEMATAGAAYHVGDEISEEMEDDGSVDEDFLKEKMETLMETVVKDYPRINECKPCPDTSAPTEWDADFSGRDWKLHDGRYLLIEDYIGNRPPPSRGYAEERAEEEEKQELERLEALPGLIGQMKARYDAAKDQLRRMRETLAQCEQRHCADSRADRFGAAVGQFFGEIFEDVELPDPTPISDEMTGDQIIACPQCIRIAMRITTAKQQKAELEQAKRETEAERRRLTPDLDRAKRKVDNILRSLSVEEGVGGESTDPQTGITTSSYDNGQGQVEIKRFDRDGNQIGETEYRTRESTADKRQKLEQAQAAYDNLKRQDDVLADGIRAIQTQIDAKQAQIEQLQRELQECLERCRAAAEQEDNRSDVSAGSNTTGRADTVLDQEGSQMGDDDDIGVLDGGDTLTPAEDDAADAISDSPGGLDMEDVKMTGEATIGKEIELDGELEVELEDARTTDGVNAFSASEVEKIHSGHTESRPIEVVIHSPDSSDATPPATDGSTSGEPGFELSSGPGNDAPLQHDYTVEPDTSSNTVTPQLTVDNAINQTPVPAPPPLDFNPFSPLDPIIHIMFSSPCPQNGPSIPVRAKDGRKVKVEVTSQHQKFSLKVTGNNTPNPTVKSNFTCNVPGKGKFSESVRLKMTDPATGQTATANTTLRTEVK